MTQKTNCDNARLPQALRKLTNRRTAIATLFGLGYSAGGTVQAGDWWTSRSRKRRAVCHPGIPVADYRSRNRTPAFRSASLSAIERGGQLSTDASIARIYETAARRANRQTPDRIETPETMSVATKEFVMAESRLGESPFAISGVRFSINSAGDWNAALRAQYSTAGSNGKPLTDLVKKRHQFHAFLRFYATRPSNANSQNPNTATAAGHLFEIELGEFWVFPNRLVSKTFGGRNLADVKYNFALVSFAEVEYFVYLDEFSRPAGLATDGRTLR